MNRYGYTGHLFEEEVLGHCLVKWDGVSYLSYAASIEAVKANQPSDPSDPQPQSVNDLHAHIAMRLGLDEWSELRFYTAVGSQLDDFHGVDAFFEFRGRVVTLDLTINPHKEKGRANMVIHPDDFENLELLALKITEQLALGAAK